MDKLNVAGFTHLDTIFRPQLIGGLHFSSWIRSWLFPNCGRAFWLPSHLSHLVLFVCVCVCVCVCVYWKFRVLTTGPPGMSPDLYMNP